MTQEGSVPVPNDSITDRSPKWDDELKCWRVPLGSRVIPGLFALVDSEDISHVKLYNWTARPVGGTVYAVRCAKKPDGKRTNIYMHRDLMPDDNAYVDHINGDGLDNRRANLRHATHRENLLNRGAVQGSESPYKGVSYHKLTGRWRARIKSDGKTRYLGTHATQEEAARAYDRAAREMFGEFAWVNFPD